MGVVTSRDLWSRDCVKILPFVLMQRVALVRKRQLSYLLCILRVHFLMMASN